MSYPRNSLRLVVIADNGDIATIKAATGLPIDTSPPVYRSADPAPRTAVGRWLAGTFSDAQFDECKATLAGTCPDSRFQTYTVVPPGKTLDAADPYFLGVAPASSPFTTGGYLADEGLTTNPN